MHRVVCQLHKDPNSCGNWIPEKADTHCLTKFKNVMNFIYDSQCRFIAKLQREGQMRGLNRWFGRWRKVSRDVMRFKVKVRQPGSQSKWLHRQREVARALMNRLDRKGFRNLYRVREEQLASAISMVNYSHSNSQSLSIAHDVVRYLQQCFRKDYSVWKQCV